MASNGLERAGSNTTGVLILLCGHLETSDLNITKSIEPIPPRTSVGPKTRKLYHCRS